VASARHWLSKAGHHRRDDPQLSPAGHLGAAELAAKCHQLHQERREPLADLGRFSCWFHFFVSKNIGIQIWGDMQKRMERYGKVRWKQHFCLRPWRSSFWAMHMWCSAHKAFRTHHQFALCVFTSAVGLISFRESPIQSTADAISFANSPHILGVWTCLTMK
jgi:hypothetical protein